MATLNDVLKWAKDKQSLKEPSATTTAASLTILWKQTRHETTGKFPTLTRIELRQLKLLYTRLGIDTGKVVQWCLLNWKVFGYSVTLAMDIDSYPQSPVPGFLLKYADVAWETWNKLGKKKIEKPTPPTGKVHYVVAKSKHVKATKEEILAALAEDGIFPE